MFVDSILELDTQHICTSFELKKDLVFFEGHYPGQPIMPGVLMCEAVFQSAGVFLSANRETSDSEAGAESWTPILTKITNARFRRMALPGEVLKIEVIPVEEQGGFSIMRGKIVNSEEKTILNLDFTITRK